MFLVLAADHQLFDVNGLFELVFHGLGCDVFAPGGFENLFFAVRDFEVALRRQGSDIAGMEPTIGVDHLSSEGFVFVIPLHDIGPFAQDLTVFGNPQFHAIENGSNGAKFHLTRCQIIYGDNRGSFGESIPFQNRNFGRPKNPGKTGLQGSSPTHDGLDISAQCFAPFTKDKFIGPFELGLVPPTVGLFELVSQSQIKGPKE